MVGPISVVFSDIFMCKIELDVVVPAKPTFFKHYVNDMYIRRMRNDVDKLFEELNSYNENITLEVNTKKFLDTEFIIEKGEIATQLSLRQQNYLSTGVLNFLLDIGLMLSLDNKIELNELHQILIMS